MASGVSVWFHFKLGGVLLKFVELVTSAGSQWVKVPHGVQNWFFFTFLYLRMYLGYMLEFLHTSEQHWKEHSQQVLFDDHK